MPEPRCSCCYDDQFDARLADDQVRAYRKRGPSATARAIAAALAAGDGASGRTILDIGAGVGAVHHLLLDAGALSALDVDASAAYLEAARREAQRRGFDGRVEFLKGDFVELADSIAPADLVSLDRVVCCYADVGALVGAAAQRTRRRLAIVVPRDNVVARIVVVLENAWQRLIRSSFRGYAHPHARIVAAAEEHGLRAAGGQHVGIWHLLVFERPTLSADSP